MQEVKRGRVPGSGRKAGSGVMGRSLRVRLPAELDQALPAAASRAGLTQSEYVRQAIEVAVLEDQALHGR